MRVRLTVVTTFLVSVFVSLAVGAAHAGPDGTVADERRTAGEETEDGYVARARVVLRGAVDWDRQARIPGPPAACWWTRPSLTADPSNPVAWKEEFGDHVAVYDSPGYGPYEAALPGGTLAALDDAIATNAITPVTWWQQKVRDSDDAGDPGDAGCARRNTPVPYSHFFAFGYFPQRPEPQVDPPTLARYAQEVMDLVPPELEWNPKIADRDGATLVNLPTWVWVTDSEAVGERQVTAIVDGLSVTVTAVPGRLRVRTGAGWTECDEEQAQVAYAPGVDEATACTVEFARPSAPGSDGVAVLASVGWTASWTSSTGDSGDLEPMMVEEATAIPVVQSQALVTDVD